MTDLEMTKLCAEAMGYMFEMRETPFTDRGVKIPFAGPYDGRIEPYSPLRDDAQAMALVKKFDIWLNKNAVEGSKGERVRWYARPSESRIFASNNDLNRAIVQCVAKMQAEKK